MKVKRQLKKGTLIQDIKKNNMIFAVYGTLKREYSNNRLLETATYLGTFKTKPVYTLYNGGFPIVERGGNTSIAVELYDTEDEETISIVHSLEGCSGKQHDPDNWYDFDLIYVPLIGRARMFVMDKGKSGRSDIIKNGIWQK